MSEPRGQTTHGQTRPPILRALLLLAAALILAAVALAVWILGERQSEAALDFPRPPDESVLPPVPPDAENGWLVVESADDVFGTPPPSEASWPREDADAMASALLAWEPPDEGEALARRAFAMPRMAPSCPLDLDHDCTAIRVLHAHRLATALALRDALEPPDGERVTLARVLALSRDAASGPRSLVTAVVGIVFVRDALERIADWLTLAESGAAAASPEELVALASALDALDPGEISLERGMIVEWIQMDRFMEGLAATAEGRALDESARATIARQYEALLERARDPSLPAPAPPRLAWWRPYTDPLGTAMIQTLTPVVGDRIDDAENERTAIADILPRLRARVQALASPAD